MNITELAALHVKMQSHLKGGFSLSRDIETYDVRAPSMDFDIEQLQFRVMHPFYFDDGDHLGIILKRIDGKWAFSDGGHFYFHMGIFVDDDFLTSNTATNYINRCRSMFDIEDRSGELISFVDKDDFATALFDLIQFWLRAMHVELFLESEREKYEV